jgi:hypothetical protein
MGTQKVAKKGDTAKSDEKNKVVMVHAKRWCVKLLKQQDPQGTPRTNLPLHKPRESRGYP